MPRKSPRPIQRVNSSHERANNSAAPEPLAPKIRHSISDAVRLLGISRAKIYQRIVEGELHPIHDGRRIFLTDAELRRYGESSRP